MERIYAVLAGASLRRKYSHEFFYFHQYFIFSHFFSLSFFSRQAATDGQQRFGLGIKVTENRPSHSLSSLNMLMLVAEPRPEGEKNAGPERENFMETQILPPKILS